MGEEITYRLAEIFAREIDPDGQMGLQICYDPNEYDPVNDEEDEVFISDLIAEKPSVAALLLVRDALAHVAKGSGKLMDEIRFANLGVHLRDAAFAIASAPVDVIRDTQYGGYRFRRQGDKLVFAFKKADDITRAKNVLMKTLLENADSVGGSREERLKSLESILGSIVN